MLCIWFEQKLSSTVSKTIRGKEKHEHIYVVRVAGNRWCVITCSWSASDQILIQEHQACVVHMLALGLPGCSKGEEFVYLLIKKGVVFLTHTLVPLVVLQIAFWTAAPVSTHQVLTAMLTPVVTITLIHICQGQIYSRTTVRACVL